MRRVGDPRLSGAFLVIAALSFDPKNAQGLESLRKIAMTPLGGCTGRPA